MNKNLCLLNWQKFLIKIPKLAKGVGKLASSRIAGGNINRQKTFWKKFGKMYWES